MSSSHVPFDIVTHVLLQLPVKTLLRFKSVCRQWLALISTPYFQSMRHRKIVVSSIDTDFHHVGNVSTLVNYSRDACLVASHVDSRPLPEDHIPDELRFMRSDGLSLKILGPQHGVHLVHNHCGDAALWNHATKALAVLSEEYSYWDLISYGFGSECMADGRVDFVVVRLYGEWSDGNGTVAELYRSSSGTWKRLNSSALEFNHDTWIHWSVHINSVLYWLVSGDGFPFLVSFDFRTETFGTLDVPVLPEQSLTEPIFISSYTCNGTKFLCLELVRLDDMEMILLVKKQQSWVKEAVISIKDLHSDKSKKPGAYPMEDLWRIVVIHEESLYNPVVSKVAGIR